MIEFLFLSAEQTALRYRASDAGIIGAPSQADEYEGRNREIYEHFWAEGHRIHEARKLREAKGYQREKTLNLRFIREILTADQCLSKEELVAKHGTSWALEIVESVIAILEKQLNVVNKRNANGDWLYDRGQWENLHTAIRKEREFARELEAMTEASKTREAA